MSRYIGNIAPQSPTMRVLLTDSDGGDFMDVTPSARSRTQRRSFTAFEDIGDFLYIGLEDRFDFVLFCLSDGVSGADYYEWEYSGDEGEWMEFIPGLDYNFYETGAERLDRLTRWSQMIINNELRYWVRVRPIDENGNIMATPVTISQLVLRQYIEYCTVREVAQLLQLPESFSASSVPPYSAIEDFIHNAQSYIDQRTRKSWRLNVVYGEEHNFNRLGQKLVKHYPIELLKAEIWDGHDYEKKNLGRNAEVFLVPEINMVHWSRFFLLPARLRIYAGGFYGWGFGEFNFAVRFSYLYGSNIYENEKEGGLVNDIAKKLAAIDVIQSYDFGINLVSGADKIDLARKSDMWKSEVEEKLDSLMAFTMF